MSSSARTTERLPCVVVIAAFVLNDTRVHAGQRHRKLGQFVVRQSAVDESNPQRIGTPHARQHHPRYWSEQRSHQYGKERTQTSCWRTSAKARQNETAAHSSNATTLRWHHNVSNCHRRSQLALGRRVCNGCTACLHQSRCCGTPNSRAGSAQEVRATTSRRLAQVELEQSQAHLRPQKCSLRGLRGARRVC